MNKPGKMLLEEELLQTVVRAFEEETGLHAQVKALEVYTEAGIIDAIILLEGTNAVELNVEIKAWAQHINTGALINRIQQLGPNGVLVTEFVNPKLAERLRNHEIQFMDTAGNAFIRAPGIHVYIKGKKRVDTGIPTGKLTQLFNPTGLKVTYILLRDPEMANAAYREIADQANVALGTVGTVMQDLKRGGFLVEKGKQREIRNYENLLNRWVETYPEKLKPKLHLGRFLAPDPDWWKKLQIMKFHAQWGGEIAAAKYTDFLKPEIATIYIDHKVHLPDLIRTATLRKLDEFTAVKGMKVNIYKRFWDLRHQEEEIVDPILTYADLIATADPRNREVAMEIQRKYLDQRIREN